MGDVTPTTSALFMSHLDLNTSDHAHYADVCNGSDRYWQESCRKFLELYAFPTVIVAGSLMNVLAVVVLQTRTYHGTSTGFLLTALSLADLGLLLTGILRMWIKVLSGNEIDVRAVSVASCKLHIFFTYLFQYMSSWTLALITVERAICVCNPFKCKELCSLRKMVIAWLIILVLMMAVNAQFFWTYTLGWNETYQTFECHGLRFYQAFLYEGAHNWMDLMFPCIGPFTVIIICNAIIVTKLLMGVVERRNMKVSTPSSNQTSSTTVMLLCVSTIFLVLVAPFSIFSLGESLSYWQYNDAYDCARLDFAYSVTYLLFNINSAINFLLYCMSGTKFRRVFVALFCVGVDTTSDSKNTSSKPPNVADRLKRSISASGKTNGSEKCNDTVVTSCE